MPWKLVNVPASEIESDTSPWSQEKSKPEICIIGKYGDDAYEVAIDPPYFLGLKFRQCRMDDPTQPGETQKAIYGTYNATRKAHHQWLEKWLIFYQDPDFPDGYGFMWKMVQIPAEQIEDKDSQWQLERDLKCIVLAKVDDSAYEVAIDKDCLDRFTPGQYGLNRDYDPVWPGEAEINVYGQTYACAKRRQRWIARIVKFIALQRTSKEAWVYRAYAQAKHLETEVDRALLCHDIQVFPFPYSRWLH